MAADRDRAWEAYREPLERERRELLDLAARGVERRGLGPLIERLQKKQNPIRKDLLAFTGEALLALRQADDATRRPLIEWKQRIEGENRRRYSSNLWSEGPESALLVPEVKARYGDSSPVATGFEILNACFDAAFARDPRLFALGEDVGRLGDVNQGFAHLQEKYGELRVSDTGIREITIVGQAIGMALRGLRPIAEIQYLDYLLYALQILSDDLASLRWRTAGGQKAPLIIRTRGHRLEGIWHAGSPMAGVINLLRGIYVCVPRDAIQAAGFYNTMLRSDDPALIVEVLNAYRRRAKVPENIADMTIPLGVPEVIREGGDVSVVTYGACCAVALEAAERLAAAGVEAEVIDVRTLLPFDRGGMIGESIRKTHRVLFLDEDVPGGASAYMLEQVLTRQGGWDQLDAPPRALSAQEHRTPYGTDGDYFAKPNRETVFEAAYELMHESDPGGGRCTSAELHPTPDDGGASDDRVVSFRFWQRWLQCVSVASALFGLLFLVAPDARVLGGYNQQVVGAFHGQAAPAAALEHQRWAIAVLGSAMLGWAILLTWVATVPFGRRELVGVVVYRGIGDDLGGGRLDRLVPRRHRARGAVERDRGGPGCGAAGDDVPDHGADRDRGARRRRGATTISGGSRSLTRS